MIVFQTCLNLFYTVTVKVLWPIQNDSIPTANNRPFTAILEDLYGKMLLDSKPCYPATFSHTNPLAISDI